MGQGSRTRRGDEAKGTRCCFGRVDSSTPPSVPGPTLTLSVPVCPGPRDLRRVETRFGCLVVPEILPTPLVPPEPKPLLLGPTRTLSSTDFYRASTHPLFQQVHSSSVGTPPTTSWASSTPVRMCPRREPDVHRRTGGDESRTTTVDRRTGPEEVRRPP